MKFIPNLMVKSLFTLILGLSIYSISAQSEFITTWKTDNPGISNNNEITLSVYASSSVDYAVDWGDGKNSDISTDGNITHTYAFPGIYTIKISGDFPGLYFNDRGDKNKIMSVDQWGDAQWVSTHSSFKGCENLDVTANDVPNISQVVSANQMFDGCSSLIATDAFNNWDTSNIANMGGMFKGCTLFNQNISSWDIGKVETMSEMFYTAETFNQPLSDWELSEVTNLSYMFYYAYNFNQDISGWDTSRVTDMSSMFNGATVFNQPIGSWNVSNVTGMSRMFQYAYRFNQDLDEWNVSNVSTMESMFHLANEFDQDISSWNVAQVTTMKNMFLEIGLSKNNYDDILNGWSNLSVVQNGVVFHAGNSQYCEGKSGKEKLRDETGWLISDRGEDCYLVDHFVTKWKTDNPGVSDDNQIMIPTFPGEIYDYTVHWGDGTSDTGVTGDIVHTYSSSGTYKVSITGVFPRIYFNDGTFDQVLGDEEKLINIAQWGNITWQSMESAFAGCRNLQVEAVDMPDLTNVQSLRRMFFWAGYWLLHIPGIEDWDISNVIDLSGMFDKTSFNQDISGWDIGEVTDMSYLFFSSSFNQDISNWDVSKVTNMSGMFGSSSFRQDVTSWDVSSVTNMDFMFNSTFFDQDISSWDVSNVRSMRHMLSQCSFNQDISGWNVGNVTDLSSIFDDNDLSRENYDKTLIAWSELPILQYGVTLGAKDVYYCSAGEAKESLTTNNGWQIIDQGQNCEVERAFLTTWKTDNPGISENNQITIPTNPREVYNYSVNWGDGTSDSGVTEDITHTYQKPGTYQVAITGRFPSIYFNSNTEHRHNNGKDADAQKILSVDQWGTNRWISMSFAFAGCTNLDVNATDVPDFSKDVLLDGMFLDCPSLVGNASFGEWDLSPVSFTASRMFMGATMFNQPIGQWDVDKVRYLDGMFQGATNFDQNLEYWNVSKVENMDHMFDGSGLSITNYDQILTAWSNLPTLLNNIKLGANNTHYCNSETARRRLVDVFDWVITDAGKFGQCNQDNDADGILDQSDDCLNTPAGMPVNEQGCSILPNDNFEIQALGETCPGSDNAQLIITATEAYDYILTINAERHSFSQNLVIDDLIPNSYEFCIEAPSRFLKQCFAADFPEAMNITGKSKLSNSKYALKIGSGTAPYSVSVNGQTILTTYSSELSFNVSDGDRVDVKTDKACEGIYSEKITGLTTAYAYPNPTVGYFEVLLPTDNEEVKISLTTNESKLVSTRNYSVNDNKVQIDISHLPQGVYFARVSLKNPVIFKIVKQ